MSRRFVFCLALLLTAGSQFDRAQGQSKKTNELIKLLGDRNPKTRQSAAAEIAELATVKLAEARFALPALRDIVRKDADAAVRLAALDALGKIEPDRHAAVLLDAVQQAREPEFRIAVVGELGKLGPRAKATLPALQDILRNPPEVPKTPPKSSKSPPGAGTPDPNDPQAVRKAIVPVLRLIDPASKEHLPLFLAVLTKDRDPGLRTAVVNAIAQQGPAVAAAARPALQDAFKAALQEASKAPARPAPPAAAVDPPGLLRQALLTAIGVMAPPTEEYLPLLTDALKKDREPAVKLTAAAALARLGPSARAALPVLLDAYKGSVALNPAADPQGARKAMVEAVGKLDREPKTYLPLLTDVLRKDRDSAVLLTALGEVARLGPGAKATLPLLREVQRQSLVTSPATDATGVRKAALDALVKIAPEPRAQVGVWLDVLQRDRDPQLRRNAVLALAKLGLAARPALPTLAEIARSGKLSSSEVDKGLAQDAETAIKAIKDAK